MKLTAIPFGTTDWSKLEAVSHPGEIGTALWRTCQFGDARVCMVDYSAGYLADHWCSRATFFCAWMVSSTPSSRMAGHSP